MIQGSVDHNLEHNFEVVEAIAKREWKDQNNGPDGSGASSDPSATIADSFFTTSPAPVSNPSSPAPSPNSMGSNSGDEDSQPGNDWPEGFSGTRKIPVNMVDLAALLLFALIAIA